jgi:hypothetical protein
MFSGNKTTVIVGKFNFVPKCSFVVLLNKEGEWNDNKLWNFPNCIVSITGSI